MALTDVQVRQAKPAQKPYALRDGTGLYLEVKPAGKYWRWDYRYQGKRKTIAYGVYPTVSLTKARAKHQAAKELLDDGLDPMGQRKAEKLESTVTFETVSRQWFKHWKADKSERHVEYVLKRLEADLFPEIGQRPISGITSSMFRDAVKKIEKRGALDIAKRALQTCNQIMRYAVAHDLTERNPVADVRPSDILQPRKKRNYSRIEEKDLPQLLKDIDGYVGGEHTRLAMQLMALTFVRTGELIAARWEEFDINAQRWNIPPERMKMKTPHIVPLSEQALAVLEKLKAISFDSDYVFPGDVYKSRHMSNNTILYALYRMGYRGRMTGHGFRGVASTILHEQGFNHAHIELQLAHQERDQVSAAYNHALYLTPRAKMMQSWADHLDILRIDNVVPLPVHKNA